MQALVLSSKQLVMSFKKTTKQIAVEESKLHLYYLNLLLTFDGPTCHHIPFFFCPACFLLSPDHSQFCPYVTPNCTYTIHISSMKLIIPVPSEMCCQAFSIVSCGLGHQKNLFLSLKEKDLMLVPRAKLLDNQLKINNILITELYQKFSCRLHW